eukprot:2749437-Alexandrium_andersonii.AAC.1
MSRSGHCTCSALLAHSLPWTSQCFKRTCTALLASELAAAPRGNARVRVHFVVPAPEWNGQ